LKKIKIVEVGARDGLQNEAKPITVATKLKLIEKLSESGLKHIEIGAFVSPKWVPQMANSDKVINKILERQKSGKLSSEIKYSCLVPNVRGMENALKTNIKEIAIFGSCSEAFSKKNINSRISESFDNFSEVIKMAKKNKIKMRGYLSMAFGDPYDGKISPGKVAKLTKKLIDMGVYEVSIGDTIGVGTPNQVEAIIRSLNVRYVPLKKVAMHFHDTRGTALANVLVSLQQGITTFDSSIGSLGGCPYAPGALGNLATEDLVYMLEGMGYKTGVSIPKLIKIKKWIEKVVDRPLASHVGNAGLVKALHKL